VADLKKRIADSSKILEKRLEGFVPKTVIVLGSGLGSLGDHVHDAIVVPYASLPGFPELSVEGHTGELIFGHLKGAPVVCLKGRQHFYEGKGFDGMKVALRTLKNLGADYLILTCAAGSLDDQSGPGSIMLIEDHINFMGTNPLIGTNDDAMGPRFVGLENAWDNELRQKLDRVATQLKMDVTHGVYAALAGPVFETPAEIRMLKILGADAVGMSTVPDCIIARHIGYRVVGCAAITNFAVGMSDDPVNHDQTLKYAEIVSHNMVQLISNFVAQL